LHALMPHKFVVHLHAIGALSYLVRKECESCISDLLKTRALTALFIGYHKPGPELAYAIHQKLKNTSSTNFVLLKNHGIVLGANSIIEMRSLLNSVQHAFPTTSNSGDEICTPIIPPFIKQYKIFDDSEVQKLAFNPSLYRRLHSDWALFPDHPVFLGEKAFTYISWEDFLTSNPESAAELIFIKNKGVFTSHSFSQAKTVQLRCYFDVLDRIPADTELSPLNEQEINDLLDWDAEKFRQKYNSTS
jgi:rhamnose utilization protein RhaD (predicted bifunctional aldolase and dehydrogenase)